LSLSVSGAAAPGLGAGLRRGGRPGCHGRRTRLHDGARGDPRDRWLWREPRLAADHARRTRDAVRDAALFLGFGQPALGPTRDDQGSVHAHVALAATLAPYPP